MSVRAGQAVSSGDHLPKSELVGALVAFGVLDYDPDAPGDYGRQPQVDVELLVCSGPHKGVHDPSWRTWGNLARQMGEQPDGTIAARVTSGPGKVKDSTWFGLDFELTEEEIGEVRACVLAMSTATETNGSASTETKDGAKKSSKKPF